MTTPSHGRNEYAARLIRFKARQLSRRPDFSLSDAPDLEQELWLDLLERLPRYDPAKASLNTFIAMIVERKVVSLLRYHLAGGRSPEREEASLNDPVLDCDQRVVDRHQTTPEVTNDPGRLRDLERDMAHVLAGMSEMHRLVALGLVMGTPNSVGVDLGTSRRATARAIDEVREIFRDAGLDQYL